MSSSNLLLLSTASGSQSKDSPSANGAGAPAGSGSGIGEGEKKGVICQPCGSKVALADALKCTECSVIYCEECR